MGYKWTIWNESMKGVSVWVGRSRLGILETTILNRSAVVTWESSLWTDRQTRTSEDITIPPLRLCDSMNSRSQILKDQDTTFLQTTLQRVISPRSLNIDEYIDKTSSVTRTPSVNRWSRSGITGTVRKRCIVFLGISGPDEMLPI